MSLEDIALWPHSEARVCNDKTDCQTYVHIVNGTDDADNDIKTEPSNADNDIKPEPSTIMIAASAGAAIVVVLIIAIIFVICIK